MKSQVPDNYNSLEILAVFAQKLLMNEFLSYQFELSILLFLYLLMYLAFQIILNNGISKQYPIGFNVK